MIKRAVDIAGSGLLLLLLSPVLAATALAVKIDSDGPVLYHARRAGRFGGQFHMYKFRTMSVTDTGTDLPLTAEYDNRTTSVGRMLRKIHLDELPQLFNVIKGDMSLVGPRPEDPQFVEYYSEQQRNVLDLRPGITGLAQLEFSDEGKLLGDGDIVERYIREILPRKLAIDLYYSQHQNMLGDIGICVRTLLLPLRSR